MTYTALKPTKLLIL